MSEKILIVDDEEIIRDSLTFILRKEGYEVDEARNGVQALEKVMATSVDIVITDIEMPEMLGLNCWKKFRCVPRIRSSSSSRRMGRLKPRSRHSARGVRLCPEADRVR